MDVDQVRDVVGGYADTRMIEGNGDFFAVYDPDHDYEKRPRQGWATIVTSNVNDDASDLDRPGVFRLNIGLPRARFAEVVDPDGDHDATALDIVMPHPVYGGYHWVCVLNPDRTWPAVQGLLDDAHAFAVRQHENRVRRRSGA
ncbi:MAG: hypothetical protein ABS81_10070 [Pseudonocardia sp. SCN 72-86]|nr:MAG: hypothetical protein ABS81_10070 [Pseudonocardia sp. SCN 72-86]